MRGSGLALGVRTLTIRHLGEHPDADDRKRDQPADVRIQADRPQRYERTRAEGGCQEDPHS
jgi:hypothetical protein